MRFSKIIFSKWCKCFHYWVPIYLLIRFLKKKTSRLYLCFIIREWKKNLWTLFMFHNKGMEKNLRTLFVIYNKVMKKNFWTLFVLHKKSQIKLLYASSFFITLEKENIVVFKWTRHFCLKNYSKEFLKAVVKGYLL